MENFQVILSLVPIKIAESLQLKTILVFKLFTYLTFVYKLIWKPFLFTFTKKKILQNFLSSNEQKVTSNEKPARSNE